MRTGIVLAALALLGIGGRPGEKDGGRMGEMIRGRLAEKIPVDRNGETLSRFYLGLDVENHWIAGTHVNWETGISDHPDAKAGIHTHCSAFVAAACKSLGIYILRPPEHGQLLLSNAQYDWLQTSEGVKAGWRRLTVPGERTREYISAQEFANRGAVVVAIFKNPDPSVPGHVALVMPKEIEVKRVLESGPMMIMAGTHNFNYISLQHAFRNHIREWPEHDILFFVRERQN